MQRLLWEDRCQIIFQVRRSFFARYEGNLKQKGVLLLSFVNKRTDAYLSRFVTMLIDCIVSRETKNSPFLMTTSPFIGRISIFAA